jgi:hypothetical protein
MMPPFMSGLTLTATVAAPNEAVNRTTAGTTYVT